MGNKDKAGSGTRSDGKPNEVLEDMRTLIIIDEVRHLEAAKGSLPPEILDNRQLDAPLDRNLERIYAIIANQTCGPEVEEPSEPKAVEKGVSFVQVGQTGMGKTYGVSHFRSPLRACDTSNDDKGYDIVMSEEELRRPREYSSRELAMGLLAALDERTASKVDIPDKELGDV
jgi:hypothetical protein